MCDAGNDNCENAFTIKSIPAIQAGTTVKASPDFDSVLDDTVGYALNPKVFGILS